LQVRVGAARQQVRPGDLGEEADPVRHGSGTDHRVGVARVGGGLRGHRGERVGDPLGGVAEHVHGALGELQPTEALGDDGDRKPGADQPDRSGEAGEPGPDDQHALHSATSSSGTGRCSTS
jgi:hypothetical protein